MKIIQIFSLFIIASSSWAQTLQPEFSFTLYAEDARGNKDSVIIGYHPDARADQVLDTRFADKDISDVPFDSVFEIRVHKVNRLFHYSSIINPVFISAGNSKHLTLLHDSEICQTPHSIQYGPGRGFILVRMKYPPLKLYWDNLLFSRHTQPCVSRTFLFYNEFITQVIFPHDLISKFTYLEDKSIVSDSVLEPVVFMNNSGKLDTLQANYLFVFSKSNLIVSTKEVQIVRH